MKDNNKIRKYKITHLLTAFAIRSADWRPPSQDHKCDDGASLVPLTRQTFASTVLLLAKLLSLQYLKTKLCFVQERKRHCFIQLLKTQEFKARK